MLRPITKPLPSVLDVFSNKDLVYYIAGMDGGAYLKLRWLLPWFMRDSNLAWDRVNNKAELDLHQRKLRENVLKVSGSILAPFERVFLDVRQRIFGTIGEIPLDITTFPECPPQKLMIVIAEQYAQIYRKLVKGLEEEPDYNKGMALNIVGNPTFDKFGFVLNESLTFENRSGIVKRPIHGRRIIIESEGTLKLQLFFLGKMIGETTFTSPAKTSVMGYTPSTFSLIKSSDKDVITTSYQDGSSYCITGNLITYQINKVTQGIFIMNKATGNNILTLYYPVKEGESPNGHRVCGQIPRDLQSLKRLEDPRIFMVVDFTGSHWKLATCYKNNTIICKEAPQKDYIHRVIYHPSGSRGVPNMEDGVLSIFHLRSGIAFGTAIAFRGSMSYSATIKKEPQPHMDGPFCVRNRSEVCLNTRDWNACGTFAPIMKQLLLHWDIPRPKYPHSFYEFLSNFCDSLPPILAKRDEMFVLDI